MSKPDGNESEERDVLPTEVAEESFRLPSYSELPEFQIEDVSASRDALSGISDGSGSSWDGWFDDFESWDGNGKAPPWKKKRDGMKDVFSDVFAEAEATDSELSKFLSDSSRRTFSDSEREAAYGKLRGRLSSVAKRASWRDAELVSEAVAAVDAVMNADSNPLGRVSWKYRDGVAKINAALKSSRKAYESAVAEEKAELALSVLESRGVSKTSHSERSKDFAREKALGDGTAAVEAADFAEAFAKLAEDPKWRRSPDFKTGLEELKRRANLLPNSSGRESFTRLKAEKLAESGIPADAFRWFVDSMRSEAELAKANPVSDMESYFMKRLARLRDSGELEEEFQRSWTADFKEFLENKRAEMRENAKLVSRHSELSTVAGAVPESDGPERETPVSEHDFGTGITAFSGFGKSVSDVAASVASAGLPKTPTPGEIADAAMRVPLVYSVVFATLSTVSGMAVSVKESALRWADYAEEAVRANLPKIVFSTAGFLCLLFVAASAYAGHVGNDLWISVQVNPRLFSPVGYSDSMSAVADASAISSSLWKIVGTAFSFMNAFIVFFMWTVLYGTVLSILFELLKVMGTVETELGSETKEAKARLAALAFSLIAVSLVMNSVFFEK